MSSAAFFGSVTTFECTPMNDFCQVVVKPKTLFDGGFQTMSGVVHRTMPKKPSTSQSIEYTRQKCYLCKGPMCSNPPTLIAPTVSRPELLGGRQSPLSQKESPQRPQVVQDAPAGGDMQVEFSEIVGDQKKSLLAPVGSIAIGGCNLSLHVAPGFFEGFGEHSNVLVRSFDIVKGRFGLITHKYASGRSRKRAGLSQKIYIFPFYRSSSVNSQSKFYRGITGG
jgi:hypothetical protein